MHSKTILFVSLLLISLAGTSIALNTPLWTVSNNPVNINVNDIFTATISGGTQPYTINAFFYNPSNQLVTSISVSEPYTSNADVVMVSPANIMSIYNAQSNTDVSRGQALLNAVSNSVNGSSIYLNSKTYDLGNNNVQEKTGTKLYGTGKYITIIKSNAVATNQYPSTGSIIVASARNSITSDLSIVGTATNSLTPQIGWGSVLSPSSFVSNSTLRNVFIYASGAGIYVGTGSGNPSSTSNSYIQNDTITTNGIAIRDWSFPLYVEDSTLISVENALAYNGFQTGPTPSWFYGPQTPYPGGYESSENGNNYASYLINTIITTSRLDNLSPNATAGYTPYTAGLFQEGASAVFYLYGTNVITPANNGMSLNCGNGYFINATSNYNVLQINGGSACVNALAGTFGSYPYTHSPVTVDFNQYSFAQNFSIAANIVGKWTANVIASNIVGSQSTNSLTFNVILPTVTLTALPVLPANVYTGIGQTITFNSVWVGGIPNYNAIYTISNSVTNAVIVQYQFNGISGTTNSLVFSPTTNMLGNTLKANVMIIDSVGTAANSSYSNTITLFPHLVGIASIQLKFSNGQNVATNIPFQQQFSFNAVTYNAYEANDLGNIRFYYGGNVPNVANQLYSWCETSCTYNSLSNSIFWIRLPSGIPANGNVLVNMSFVTTNTEYDGVYAGEAPQLSKTYAQYDNGGYVFNALYQNFNGNTVPSGWTASAVTVNNGVSLATGSSSIYETTNVISTTKMADMFGSMYACSSSGYVYFGEISTVSIKFGFAAAFGMGCDSTYSTANYVAYAQTYNGVLTIQNSITTALVKTANQIFSQSTTASSETSYVNYTNLVTLTIVPGGSELGVFQSGTSNSFIQYIRLRTTPPNNIMPSLSGNLILYVPPNTPTITSPTNIVADVGQSETFSTSFSAGTSPYTYNWIISNAVTGGVTFYQSFSNSLTSNTILLQIPSYFATNSPLKANVVVTDSNLTTVNSLYSSNFVVNAAPSASLTFSNSLLDAGQSTTLSAILSGGAGPFTANFIYANGIVANTVTGISVGGTATYKFVPGAVGTYTFNVVATDKGTTTAYVFNTAQTSVTVNSVLSSGILTETNTLIDSGQVSTLTANPSGGTSPYTINWFSQAACGGASFGTGTTRSVSPSSTTTYTYNVVDSATTNSVVCSSSNSITVNSAASTSAPSLSLIVFGVGLSTTISTTISGGTGTFTANFVYSNGIVANTVSGLSIGGTANYVFFPGSPGTYPFNVIVTDTGTTIPFVFNSVTNTITVTGATTTTISNGGGGGPGKQTLTLNDNLSSSFTSGTPVFNVYIKNASGTTHLTYNQNQLPATVTSLLSSTVNFQFACSFSAGGTTYHYSGTIYGIGLSPCGTNYTTYGGSYKVLYSNSIPATTSTTSTASSTVPPGSSTTTIRPILTENKSVIVSPGNLISVTFTNNVILQIHGGSELKGEKTVNVTITNKTGSSTIPPPNYTKIYIFYLNVSNSADLSLNVSEAYDCNIKPGSVAAFYLAPNSTWIRIYNSIAVAQTCTITFSAANKHIIGLFAANGTSLINSSSIPTTTIPAPYNPNNGNGYAYLAAAAAVVALIIVASYLLSRKRGI